MADDPRFNVGTANLGVAVEFENLERDVNRMERTSTSVLRGIGEAAGIALVTTMSRRVRTFIAGNFRAFIGMVANGARKLAPLNAALSKFGITLLAVADIGLRVTAVALRSLSDRLLESENGFVRFIGVAAKAGATTAEILVKALEKAVKILLGLKIAAIAAAAGLAAVGTVLAVKFNREFQRSATLIPEHVGSLRTVREELNRLIGAYGADAPDALSAFYDTLSALPQLVNEPNRALRVMEAALAAAATGFTTTGEAVDAITTVVNAYGIEVEDAERITSSFFAAQDAGKTTFGELAAEIGKVAAQANSLGVSFEETLGVVTTLTGAGIGTSEAFTQLRAVLTAIQRQAPQAVAAAKAFGVEFNRSAIESRGFAAVLEDILRLARENPEAIPQIFGEVEAITLISALSERTEEFGAALEGIQGSAGRTQEVLDEINDTFSRQKTLLAADFQAVLTEVGFLFEAIGTAGLKAVNGIFALSTAIGEFVIPPDSEFAKLLGSGDVKDTLLGRIGVVLVAELKQIRANEKAVLAQVEAERERLRQIERNRVAFRGFAREVGRFRPFGNQQMQEVERGTEEFKALVAEATALNREMADIEGRQIGGIILNEDIIRAQEINSRLEEMTRLIGLVNEGAPLDVFGGGTGAGAPASPDLREKPFGPGDTLEQIQAREAARDAALQGSITQINRLRQSLETQAVAASRAADDFDVYGETLKASRGEIDALILEQIKYQESIGQTSDRIDGLRALLSKPDQQDKTVSNLREQADEAVAAFRLLTAAGVDVAEMPGRIADRFEEFADSEERVQSLSKALLAGFQAAATAEKRVKDLEESLEKLGGADKVDGATEALAFLKREAEAAKEAAKGLLDSFDRLADVQGLREGLLAGGAAGENFLLAPQAVSDRVDQIVDQVKKELTSKLLDIDTLRAELELEIDPDARVRIQREIDALVLEVRKRLDKAKAQIGGLKVFDLDDEDVKQTLAALEELVELLGLAGERVEEFGTDWEDVGFQIADAAREVALFAQELDVGGEKLQDLLAGVENVAAGIARLSAGDPLGGLQAGAGLLQVGRSLFGESPEAKRLREQLSRNERAIARLTDVLEANSALVGAGFSQDEIEALGRAAAIAVLNLDALGEQVGGQLGAIAALIFSLDAVGLTLDDARAAAQAMGFELVLTAEGIRQFNEALTKAGEDFDRAQDNLRRRTEFEGLDTAEVLAEQANILKQFFRTVEGGQGVFSGLFKRMSQFDTATKEGRDALNAFVDDLFARLLAGDADALAALGPGITREDALDFLQSIKENLREAAGDEGSTNANVIRRAITETTANIIVSLISTTNFWLEQIRNALVDDTDGPALRRGDPAIFQQVAAASAVQAREALGGLVLEPLTPNVMRGLLGEFFVPLQAPAATLIGTGGATVVHNRLDVSFGTLIGTVEAGSSGVVDQDELVAAARRGADEAVEQMDRGIRILLSEHNRSLGGPGTLF